MIENDELVKVGFEKMDKGDQTIEIYNDQTLKVGLGSSAGSQTVEIFKDRTVTLKTGNDSLKIETGNMTVKLDVGGSTTDAMQSIELVLDPTASRLIRWGLSSRV